MITVLVVYSLFAIIIKLIEKTKERKAEKRKTMKDEEYLISDFFADKNIYQQEISLKMEYYRKLFHLAGLLVLLSYYVMTPLVNNATLDYILGEGKGAYESIWGNVNLYPYNYNDIAAARDLTWFALWGTFAFICFPEYIRILIGARYSLYNRVTKSVLRGKEYKSAGPQVFLVLGSISSYFMAELNLIPYEAAIASIIVLCFSDAIAAVIGRRFGRHKIKTFDKSIKSIEGFIAGVGSAYIFAIIFIGSIYAIFVAIVFFLLDYFTIPIADNLLNPILISVVLYLCYLFIPLNLG
ncbi:MAG: diacylglycerol/polyprenol kinase family protein [Promethearchaeota archaeon]